jgi:hypothetical protein
MRSVTILLDAIVNIDCVTLFKSSLETLRIYFFVIGCAMWFVFEDNIRMKGDVRCAIVVVCR